MKPDLEELKKDFIRLNGAGQLRFKKPRALRVQQDESGQLLVVEDAELGISVCAFTREELAEEIEAELQDLWRTYIEGKAPLSEDAKQLRESLQHNIEFVRS